MPVYRKPPRPERRSLVFETETLPEPLMIKMGQWKLQNDADKAFGDLLEECGQDGMKFVSITQEAFRKRAEGKELGDLEGRVLALLDKIDVLDALRRMGGTD